MQYKLLATDLDGTLLTTDKRITEKTERALRAAAEKGILHIPATGRPMHGVNLYRSQLPLNSLAITYNGAVVVDPKTGEALFECGLTKRDALHIYALFKETNATFCCWSKDNLYVNVIDENVRRYRELSGATPIVFSDFEKIAEQGVTKILWIDTTEETAKHLSSILSDELPDTTFCTSTPHFLEFFNRSVSKGVALQKVCELVGIDPSEAVAVGDANNDLPMLLAAGLGVAMGNSADEVKKQCGYVTASNDEDGIVQVVKEIFGITA